MKTIISTIFLCVLLSFIPELRAQNIQLHYDFGRSLYDKDLKERPLLTSTVENLSLHILNIMVDWQKDSLTKTLTWQELLIPITMLLFPKASL